MKEYPFVNPADRFRGMDLYMVNDKLEDSEIEKQIFEFREKGLYSVIFRTYNGLISDYPGEGFKHSVRVAVEAAKKCGLKLVLQAGFMPSAYPVLPREFALHRIVPVKTAQLTGEEQVLATHGDVTFTDVIAPATVNMIDPRSVDYYIRTAYEEMWVAMLKAFSQHLREKGWFPITTIAMDERPMQAMKKAIAVIRKADPEFKVALAGNWHPEIEADLYDYCIALDQAELLPEEIFARRKSEGKKTTIYTCCSTHRPNTFTFSVPAEGAWYGFYVAGTKYDGYLRWAYNSWVKNPLHDTRFRSWPAGDTYMVYPYGRSSVRFEKLIEGIQAYEKIRILREEYTAEGNTAKLAELDALQERFNFNSQYTHDFSTLIRSGQDELNAL